MTPIPPPLSLFFLLSLVASSSGLRRDDCAPTSCGNVTDITYPFWVLFQQPDYCGIPEFKLYCDEYDTTSLKTPKGAYYVRSIFYANHSILVAPMHYADCPIYHNITFTTTYFNVSITNRELFLIHNCNNPPLLPPDYYAIPCGGNGSFSFLGGNYSFQDHLALPAPCQVQFLPVLGFPGAKPSDYNKLINDGFLIDWTEADNCSDCKLSGGDCGFNSTTESFMCICDNDVTLTHSRSCNETFPTNPRKWRQTHVAILVAVSLAVIVLCSLVLLTWIRCKHKHRWMKLSADKTTLPFGIGRVISLRESEKAFMSPLYPLNSIIQATDNFSNVNKLGEGGFGPVYKV